MGAVSLAAMPKYQVGSAAGWMGNKGTVESRRASGESVSRDGIFEMAARRAGKAEGSWRWVCSLFAPRVRHVSAEYRLDLPPTIQDESRNPQKLENWVRRRPACLERDVDRAMGRCR